MLTTKEYTVKYRLTAEQEKAMLEIAGAIGSTIEREFSLMMEAGSAFDIDAKIAAWRRLTENGAKKARARGNGRVTC